MPFGHLDDWPESVDSMVDAVLAGKAGVFFSIVRNLLLAPSNTASSLSLEAEIARPLISGVIQVSVGWHLNGDARPVGLPVTALAVPIASRTGEVSVWRYLDRHARVAAFRPKDTAGAALQVSVPRRDHRKGGGATPAQGGVRLPDGEAGFLTGAGIWLTLDIPEGTMRIRDEPAVQPNVEVEAVQINVPAFHPRDQKGGTVLTGDVEYVRVQELEDDHAHFFLA